MVLAYAACGSTDDKVKKDLLREAKSRDDEAAAFGLAALWRFAEDEDAQKLLVRAFKSGSLKEGSAAAWTIGMAEWQPNRRAS